MFLNNNFKTTAEGCSRLSPGGGGLFHPPASPTPSLLSVCLFSLCPAVDCTWAWMARAGQAAAWALRSRESSGEGRGGCTDFNEMHSVNGHSLWRGQEEKGALSFSPLPSPLCPFLQLLLSPALLPSWRGALWGARWYPRCPDPAAPFSYIHQPSLRLKVTTGHLNGSPWQQWSCRLREWQRFFVVAWLPRTLFN